MLNHENASVIVVRNDKRQKIEKEGPTTGPVVLRQGEPGTSQYIHGTKISRF